MDNYIVYFICWAIIGSICSVIIRVYNKKIGTRYYDHDETLMMCFLLLPIGFCLAVENLFQLIAMVYTGATQ